MDTSVAYSIENLIRFYQEHHGYGWATLVALLILSVLLGIITYKKRKLNWFYKK